MTTSSTHAGGRYEKDPFAHREAAKAEAAPLLSWEDWTGGLATTDRAPEPAPYGVGTVGARRPGDQGAPRFPLARGWERQLDIADNPLFYGGALTGTRYERWLKRLAVRYVAVPIGAPRRKSRYCGPPASVGSGAGMICAKAVSGAAINAAHSAARIELHEGIPQHSS